MLFSTLSSEMPLLLARRLPRIAKEHLRFFGWCHLYFVSYSNIKIRDASVFMIVLANAKLKSGPHGMDGSRDQNEEFVENNVYRS